MIDFLVVSLDLQLHVLDTQVRRGAALSTVYHLVVNCLRWRGRTRQTQMYCKGLLGMSGRVSCKKELQIPLLRQLKPFSCGNWGGFEFELTMLTDSVAAKCLVPVRVATPDGEGCQQTERSMIA